MKPRIIALSVAILLLSAVVAFAGLPDYTSSPADTAHAQGKGRVDLDHKVYLPAVMKALDTTPPIVVSVGGASLSYDVDGQTIQRTIVVQDLGGAYSFDGTGDEGDIPYEITSTLTITGIQTNVDLTDILVEDQQGIEAQVTDACGPGENPCDISVSLNPTHQPESPIDDSVPYSFTIDLVAYEGQIQLGGAEGEIFNPFVIEDDWLYPHIDFDEIAQVLQDPEIRANYKITTRWDQFCDFPHNGDEFENYTVCELGSRFCYPAPSYRVFMPMHSELVTIWSRYEPEAEIGSGIQFNTSVGRNIYGEPIYFSLLHLGDFEQGLKQELATYLGITPEELDVDIYDPEGDVGPFTFDPPVRIEAGRLISIYDYWRNAPFSPQYHSQEVHLNLNRNELGDRTNHPEFVYPYTEFYLNWIITGLVLNKDTPIGLEYEPKFDTWASDPVVLHFLQLMFCSIAQLVVS